MLTRKKLGYAPGTMDVIYLRQDIDGLDARLHSALVACHDLLRESSELETEARRLGVPEPLARVLIQRSRILLANRCYADAITALADADQVLGNLRQYDLKVGIYAGLAEAHAHLQEWQKVFDACQKGITIVETYRYKVSGQYLQSAYLHSRIGLYARGVQAAFQKKDYRSMLQWAELSKCRSVLRNRQKSPAPAEEEERNREAFRLVCREIDAARAAGNGLVSDLLLAKRRALWDLLLIERAQGGRDDIFPEFDLSAVQAVLDADEAVIYYFWLDLHTLLIAVIDHEQFVPKLYSITAEERAALDQYSRSILQSSMQAASVEYVDQVRNFASSLLPPAIRDCLKQKSRLLISPHRSLHALPFHALPWDDRDRYLIQRFAVTYTPNLSCLLLRYPAPAQHRLLALGICNYEVPGHQPLPLEKAEMEVDELHRLYSENGFEVSAVSGSAACKDGLRRLEQRGELAAFTRLHIATHGYSVNSDTPMESYLFLHDSTLEGLEIADWRLGAELVVLSACCSGQRPIDGRGMDELPGDDLFGLQAAFFAAGAKRVLGSLWPVHVDVAPAMMTAFHRFLVAGQSAELALQSAVVEHLDNAGPRFRKSFYWAPFFLSAVGRPIAEDKETEPGQPQISIKISKGKIP